MGLSQSEIKKELLRRKLATERIVPFTQFVYPIYNVEPVHELIGAALDGVVSGEIPNLIVNTPPQLGKSRLCSVSLPALWFGKNPDLPAMLGSYSAGQATYLSGSARDVVDSEAYRQLFPKIKIRQDARATDFWRIANHSGFLNAAGVGGPLTGKSAVLGIVDDPFENDEQAQSPTIREKVFSWYETVFLSRMPKRIVIVCTRWHEDDLVGRILNHPVMSKQGWKVVRVPALNETQEERDHNNKKLGLAAGESDPLGRPDPIVITTSDGIKVRTNEQTACARTASTEEYQARRATNALVWTTLYQNAPVPIEGMVIQREMFQYMLTAPICVAWVRYWDKAGTQDGGKRTAGVLMGYQRHSSGVGGNIIIAHVKKGHWDAARREPIILETAERDRRMLGPVVQTWLEQEPGSGGKESAQNSVRNLQGFIVQSETVSGDKLVRAQPFLAQVIGLNVFLVKDGKDDTWQDEFIDEIVAIPNGKFMDQLDGASGAFAHVITAAPQGAPAVSGEQVSLKNATHNLPVLYYRGVKPASKRFRHSHYVSVEQHKVTRAKIPMRLGIDKTNV